MQFVHEYPRPYEQRYRYLQIQSQSYLNGQRSESQSSMSRQQFEAAIQEIQHSL